MDYFLPKKLPLPSTKFGPYGDPNSYDFSDLPRDIAPPVQKVSTSARPALWAPWGAQRRKPSQASIDLQQGQDVQMQPLTVRPVPPAPPGLRPLVLPHIVAEKKRIYRQLGLHLPGPPIVYPNLEGATDPASTASSVYLPGLIFDTYQIGSDPDVFLPYLFDFDAEVRAASVPPRKSSLRWRESLVAADAQAAPAEIAPEPVAQSVPAPNPLPADGASFVPTPPRQHRRRRTRSQGRLPSTDDTALPPVPPIPPAFRVSLDGGAAAEPPGAG